MKISAWSIVIGCCLNASLPAPAIVQETKLPGTNSNQVESGLSSEGDQSGLPPELRALERIRPDLPADAAIEVTELQKQIAALESNALRAETRDVGLKKLDAAIECAERVLLIRTEHQGNSRNLVRWRNSDGEPDEWYELTDARLKLDHLRRLHELDESSLRALASIEGTDTEYQRLIAISQNAQAQILVQQQLAIRRRILGTEHPDVLTAISNLAYVLEAQDKLLEVEPYCHEALETSSRVLGREHPDTLASIGNMGQLLQELGRMTEAEPLVREVLKSSRHVLGDDHPGTIVAISNMGHLLVAQGRLSEAEPFQRKALDASRRVLGNKHPDTQISINNFGHLLYSQGKLAEAEPFFREALETRLDTVGDKHPDTLNSINNLGALLAAQGRSSEAEPYFRQSLETSRAVLGSEHPDTLYAIHNLGYLLRAQGKLSDAELLYRQALETCRRVLGDEHPFALTVMNNLGQLLMVQGKLREAEAYCRQALETRRRTLGSEHLDTLASIINMCEIIKAQGNAIEAKPYLLESLETSKRVLGEEHPVTLVAMTNVGHLLQTEGKLSEAEPHYMLAMETSRRTLGNEHPNTLKAVNNMASLRKTQGRLAEAERYWLEVLNARRRLLGDNHTETLFSIKTIGLLQAAQGNLSDAEQYLNEALTTAERLRVDVIGGAQDRAQFAAELDLPVIAGAYAQILTQLGRDIEALTAIERGRGRAGLDLFGGERREAERKIREQIGDSQRVKEYELTLAEEESARFAVFETEARLAAVPENEKAELNEQVKRTRLVLSEKTAALFARLREVVPQIDPMAAEEILAALQHGQGLAIWAWTPDGAAALVARDGHVDGFKLAGSIDEMAKLNEAIVELRDWTSERPENVTLPDELVLNSVRDKLLFREVREQLSKLNSLIVVPDGPLQGIPMELLIEDVPISYAPSATIAINRKNAAGARTGQRATAVVLGDPVFAGSEQPAQNYPETGVLLAMVAEGSNAASAGIRRGDVLLKYAEKEVASSEELATAIQAIASSTEESEVGPISVELWRDGLRLSLKVPPGKMGVILSPAPPAEGLRSMEMLDRAADDNFSAEVSAMEQIRLYGGSLDRLPGTRTEAAAVAALFGEQATLLTGPDASQPRLRAAIESSPPRALHLATHGLMGSADRPLLASLALTTPAQPTLEDTGFLTLEEIMATWGAKLNGTELVVLSACDTATGVQQGDTMMALPLGLFVCGAESVVCSLWKVDDQATALLMTRFYSNWLGKTTSERTIDGVTYAAGEPLTKLAALREAKAWLRSLARDERDQLLGLTASDMGTKVIAATSRSGGDDDEDGSGTGEHPYAHPYYWAAFVLYGSPE